MNKYAALTVLMIAPICFAGSLTPPGPPTAGTMKPLDQVEPRTPITSVPFTIGQSGSYYLTKDMSCAGTAITVSVDNVTIDLCGFTLTGTGTTGVGINMSMQNNVEIRNGTITCFPEAGIRDFSPNSGDGHRVIGVRLISNGTYGIALEGNGHTVKDCSVQGTLAGFDTLYGIIASGGSIVSGCSVSEIGTSSAGNVTGISVAAGCTVTDCTVYSIGRSASGQVCGIYSSVGGIVANSAVYNNGVNSTGSVYGIKAGTAVTVIGNTVHANGLSSSGSCYGIYLSQYGLADRNTSSNNGNNLHFSATTVLGTNCAP